MGRQALKWVTAAASVAWLGGCTALLGLDDKKFDRDEGATSAGGGSVGAGGAGAGGSGGGPGAVCGLDEVPSAAPRWSAVTTSDMGRTLVGGIAIDETSGDLWVAGSFQGNVAVQGCAAVTTTSGQAVFWARLRSADGACEASGVLGGNDVASDHATARGIALDSGGNAALVGRFRGSMSAGGTTISSSGDDDMFVIKLDSTGAPVWAQSYGEAAGDTAEAVVIETADQIFVGGSSGTPTLGDLAVRRIGAGGSEIFSGAYSSPEDDRVNAVAFSPSVPFVLTGYIGGDVSVGDLMLTTTEQNAFVATIDTQGAGLRAVANPGDGVSVGRAAAVTVDGDYVFAAGDFSRKLDLDGDPGSGGLETLTVDESDGFVVRLDLSKSGAARYAQLGQPADSAGAHDDHIAAMALDPKTEQSLVVAGSVRGRACFLGAEREAVVGSDDLFVAEVDAELNGPLWVSVFGEASGGGDQSAAAVAIHPTTGDVIVAGTFNGNLNLGTGTDIMGPRVGTEVFILALERP